VIGVPGKTTVLVTHATPYGKQRPEEHSRSTWPTGAAQITHRYAPAA